MTSLAIAGGLALGAVIGIISGMIGIGGGAFLIPALIFFYGMSQKTAQGTSVATLLLPIGIFAFWTYYKAGHVDLKLAMLIAGRFCSRRIFWRSLGTTPVRRGSPQGLCPFYSLHWQSNSPLGG